MISLNNPNLWRTQAYVGGQWINADSYATLTVRNPANGALLAEVADVGPNETRRALLSADTAFRAWSKRTATERCAILRRWYDLILANLDDLGLIMTLEQGKPLAEAKGEVRYGASFVEWFAEEGKRSYGEFIPTWATDRRILAIKQPIGVAAAITPWNFPNAMITRKVAPALAAGCTMVVKPAEATPLSALALAYLAEQAGVPPGVFSVVTTSNSPAVGRELTQNPLVRKFSFTGSTEVGKLLMKQCADTMKKLSLELGGNAPFIVFDDADLDAAVEGAIASKYRNAGQTCVCANRLYIQAGVYEAFAEKYAQAVRGLRVGQGWENGVTIGPLINMEAIEKVEALVADALGKGAQALTGGHRHELGGNFYEPTVLINVTDEMACTQEEIFGPVAPLYRFAREEEAVRWANDTPFGLAAYFYSREIGRIWRVAEGLEYGMVGVNTGLISHAAAPFGGVKESGIGREGGKQGLDEYLETKYVAMAGL